MLLMLTTAVIYLDSSYWQFDKMYIKVTSSHNPGGFAFLDLDPRLFQKVGDLGVTPLKCWPINAIVNIGENIIH